ncbi:N-acetyl-gamma-glutamyl-phosphate reductase [Mycetocola reblochoni]|uniref:N-acetyl-gamma-glutamyl-phosphate reductase n=2 Tax=Mycetocola reblochoni TaxID=331618 RepID=A0A1R4IEK4_9MICO|nr:N-acetyl-gamma-glutamyl-phosphate reductase [Mycetocola reblochoni]RLP68141.1 N-acetyl-gamma-glutamyl-phosphate reductase [Mycetocola reblochoni]SJN17974.1 N-acetyl-gamma-glutamyl-phosphate reductase [Mycetocola reblochoni REB411]
MSYTVAVAGASGYAGGEILRLLAAHPELTVTTITGHSSAGADIVEVQPHLRSYAGMRLVDTTAENLAGHDVVFVALPHGASGAVTAGLGDDVLVVDCGADHRLVDPGEWDRYYGGEYFGAWSYGVPELPRTGTSSRQLLEGARRIAAPGCNASTVALSVAPGVLAGVVEAEDVVSVLAVGPSGAGKSAKVHLLASEMLGSASAYAVGGTHRHIPEILQSLRAAGAGPDATISFTPVLVPMSRGILATSTARIAPGVGAAEVRAAWERAYADEPFVQLLPEGQFPRTADVLGANTCLLGLAVDEAAGRVTVVAAVDNLVKGTAGAAIQSANIALGLPETTGLSTNGVAP